MASSPFDSPVPLDDIGDLNRRISDLERTLTEFMAARTLERATITAEPGLGIRTGDFDGTSFSDPGTMGNYFGGDGAVLNALYLRPGSISNNVLANPISGEVRNVTGTGFGLSVAFVELAGADVTVPNGFTTLLAKADADVFAYNPNTTGGNNGTGGDAIYSMVQLGSQQGKQKPVSVSGSGGYQTSFSGAAFQFTGLTAGQTLRLSCFGSSAYQSFAANTNNNASVSALLLWLR